MRDTERVDVMRDTERIVATPTARPLWDLMDILLIESILLIVLNASMER
jgi:hypothetical protein